MLCISEKQSGGGGLTSNLQADEKLLHNIATLVHQKFLQPPPKTADSSQYPTSIWQPSNFLPPVAEAETINNSQQLPFPNLILKDDLNDQFDEIELLRRIPKAHKDNALKLLKFFDDRANELTWNSSGVIFIDQVALPNTNIFVLFPYLFKKNRPKKITGLEPFIEKINEMGLQDYIVVKNKATSSLDDRSFKSSIEKPNEAENLQWWYIGD